MILEMDRKHYSVSSVDGNDIISFMIKEKPSVYKLLSTENDGSYNGKVYEVCVNILGLTKCIQYYDTFYYYNSNLKRCECIDKWEPLEDSRLLFEKSISTGPDGGIDLMMEENGKKYYIQVKHSPNIAFQDLGIDALKRKYNIDESQIILVLNDVFLKPNDKKDRDILKKIKTFKKKDIEKFLNQFYCICEDYNIKETDELYKFINKNFLNQTYEHLSKTFHQDFSVKLWEENWLKSIEYHYIHYKPRTGKTIIHLSICKKLVEMYDYEKILVLTPYPSTLRTEYKKELNRFFDFKNLSKKSYFHCDGTKLTPTFKGIYFCSLQLTKGEYGIDQYIGPIIETIKKIGFEYFILDEAHYGSLTKKTKDVLDSIPGGIYTSGTLDIVKEFRPKENSYVYEWNLLHEGLMKKKNYNILREILCKNEKEIELFNRCLENPTISKDYTNYPSFVLFNPLVGDHFKSFVSTIREKYGNEKGVDISSIFSLHQTHVETILKEIKQGKNKGKTILKKKKIYGKLELDDGGSGTDFLVNFFKFIHDTDPNNPYTIMETYHKFCRNHNEPNDTKIIILFLPILGEKISQLQKVLREFLEDHTIFPDWLIITSDDNLTENQMLFKMKEKGKKKILFLTGRKGGTGTTYNTSSLCIFFDSSQSIIQFQQHFYRAGTPKKNHQFFFCFDMNIFRTFQLQYIYTEQICDYFKGKKTMEESYCFLREKDLIKFNPTEYFHNFLSKEEQYELFKKDWSEIEESMVHNGSNNNIVLSSMNHFDIDNSIIEELYNILLPSMKKSVIKFNSEINHSELDFLRPKEIKRKLFKNQPKEVVDDYENKKEIIIHFLHSFFHNISLWIVLQEISFEEFLEDNILFFEILERYIDDKKINNSSFNKDNLIISMKRISRINHKLLDSLRRIYEKKTSIQSIRKQVETLEEMNPSRKEKEERGFIITPSSLGEKMVDTIPISFWEKEHSTLDPCCGYGIFPLLVLERFFQYLPIKNKEKRVRTIIEKCIFFSDINPYNVKITKQLLQFHCNKLVGKKVEGLQYNSWVGDTLKLDYKRKFDSVMGNPPYQKQVGPNKTQPIWHLFVEKSLSLLEQDGYLIIVHPSGWRNVSGLFQKIKEKLLSKDILYLEIHNVEDGKKIFKGCETRYDWYILQNKNTKNLKTKVVFEDGKKKNINLKNEIFIPNGGYDELKTLIAKPNEPKCDILYDSSSYEPRRRWMSKEKTSEYKYPCVYTINHKGNIKKYYSSERKGHFGVPKLIWSNGRISSIGSYIDDTGEYGLTCFAYAIVDDKTKLKDIKKVFDSKKFRKLMELCSVGQNTINYKIISLFKKDWYKEFL